MENNELKVVPLVAYESMLAREDRQQRRMVIIIVLLILLLAVSNGLWLYFWNSYDYVDDYSVEVDGGEGGNAVDRRILRKRLIDGKTISSIADDLYREDKTVLSERQIQNRLYKAEDNLFRHL